MTSTTDPTVPLPTATDTDDDDDDDVSSSLLASQPPAATPPPSAQPTITSSPASPAETVPAVPTTPASAPSSPSTFGSPSISESNPPSSATELADSLPSGSTIAPNPTSPGNNANGGGNGLSAGASAGIGISIALIVCLAAFGTWFFLRRRKARRTKTHSTLHHSSDEEHAPRAQPPKSEVYAYRAVAPAEVSGDEKPRRWSELESPAYVAEAGEGQVFRAELPGSAVPVTAARKGGDERLFADAPIDEIDEPIEALEEAKDEKKDERLFSDPPIDEETETLAGEPIPTRAEKKA